MANRAFLILADSADPNAAYDDLDARVVAAANSMLPVLWFSAFSRHDVYWRTLASNSAGDERDKVLADEHGDDGDGNVAAYPVLLAPVDTAKQRARERKALFLTRFPSSLESVYDDWLALLDGIDTPYLLVEAVELWSMGKPTEFEALLDACARAFEADDPRDWDMLLGQTAGMRYNIITEHVLFLDDRHLTIELHGYEWMRPVPWLE